MCESGTSLIDTLSHERYTVAFQKEARVIRGSSHLRDASAEASCGFVPEVGFVRHKKVQASGSKATLRLHERHWA